MGLDQSPRRHDGMGELTPEHDVTSAPFATGGQALGLVVMLAAMGCALPFVWLGTKTFNGLVSLANVVLPDRNKPY